MSADDIRARAGADAEATRRAVLEAAVGAAGIGTFDWDMQADVLTWDAALLDIFGYADPSEFSGTIEGFFSRLHPDDRERVDGLIVEATDTLGEYDAEYRVVRPGGDTVWVHARGRVLGDADGRPARLIGAAFDTTAARDADARVARVMDSMSTAFFALDRAWRFSYVNAQAERLLGRRRSELLGRELWHEFPAAAGTDFDTYYRHAMASGEPVAFDAWYPAPLNAWYEVRAWPNPDGLAVYFLDVSDRRRAAEAAELAASRAALLGRVTEALTEAAEPELAVGDLPRLVVPAIADWAVLTLVHDVTGAGRAGMHVAGTWHRDAALRPAVERYAKGRLEATSDEAMLRAVIDGGAEQMVAGGATEYLLGVLGPGPEREAVEELRPEAGLVLPLRGSTGTIGLLTLCDGADRGGFTADEVASAREVAARAALVLDRARLYRQQRAVAEELTRSMLTDPPQTEHLQIATRYRAAAEATRVGGDWYDAFLQADGSAVLVIGDVMGHDVSAAAAMGQVRTLVRGLAAASGGRPAEVLAQVDEVMATLQVGTTATATVARLEPDDTADEQLPAVGAGRRLQLRWSNAGHPPAILLDTFGTATVLDSPPDVLLGVAPRSARSEHVTPLGAPSTVLLYTDGLVERRDEPITDGLERLRRIVEQAAGLDLEQLCEHVLDRMLPERPDDDVALVAVRVRS